MDRHINNIQNRATLSVDDRDSVTGAKSGNYRNTGGVAFALPCEVVFNREVENEIARLKCEITNNKMIKLYEEVQTQMHKYLD
jgi:hypothetical protein